MRAESSAFYEMQMSDPKATPGEKRMARRAFDELHGLDAPKTQHITTPPGQPFETKEAEKMPKLTVPELREALAKLRALPNYAGNGNGHAPPP
jgi:hypothetical protein